MEIKNKKKWLEKIKNIKTVEEFQSVASKFHVEQGKDEKTTIKILNQLKKQMKK